MINILTGLLNYKSGEILVDNQINIFHPNYLKNWQKKIGYVPQNIFIHDNSIIENVAFGIDYDFIDISRIISLLEDMQLYEFAENIKKDPKKSLGEYGDKISGGQKQRLGIARALYNNPEILILDESTSALDLANEEKIIKDILNLKKRNITVLIISHRQSSLKHCDKIYTIETANDGITVEYETGLGRSTLDVIQSNSILLNSKISLANSEEIIYFHNLNFFKPLVC